MALVCRSARPFRLLAMAAPKRPPRAGSRFAPGPAAPVGHALSHKSRSRRTLCGAQSCANANARPRHLTKGQLTKGQRCPRAPRRAAQALPGTLPSLWCGLEHNPVTWSRLRCAVARRSARRGAKGDAGASAERRNAAGARPGATRRAGVFCGHGFVAKLASRHRYVLRPAPARGTKFLRRSQFNLTGLCSTPGPRGARDHPVRTRLARRRRHLFQRRFRWRRAGYCVRTQVVIKSEFKNS